MRLKIISLITFVLFMTISSCKKDEDEVVTLSDEEIVTTVENSLKASEGGATINIDQTAKITDIYVTPSYCGITKDSATSVTGPGGRYVLNSNWHWIVNCIGLVPSNIVYTLTGNSTYNGTRVTMNATLGGNATLTNLITGTNYILNGTISRTGNTTIVTNNITKNFSSTLSFTLTNLNILKSTYGITSGTGIVSINGTITNGNAYSRTASITFNGGGSATLTLDNGSIFTINL